jgi:hypothetical protein
MVFPERENSSPARLPWSRQNSRAIPASSSKGTSTSGTSGKSGGSPRTDSADTKQHNSDGSIHPVNDTSNRPKLGIQTGGAAAVAASQPEIIDDSPGTAIDDQVTDVMTVPVTV